MTSMKQRGLIAALALTTALLMSGAARAADEEPAGAAAGKKLIDAHAKMILRSAHPLVTYVDHQYDGCSKLKDGGFQLAYTFNFEDIFGRPQYTMLKFNFDTDGFFDYTGIGRTSNLLPPFAMSNGTIALVKEDFKLKDVPLLQNSKQYQRALEENNAKGLMDLMLQIKSGKQIK